MKVIYFGKIEIKFTQGIHVKNIKALGPIVKKHESTNRADMHKKLKKMYIIEPRQYGMCDQKKPQISLRIRAV